MKVERFKDNLESEFFDLSNVYKLGLIHLPALDKRKVTDSTERCPVCGSTDLTVNEDGMVVCKRCGTVVRPSFSVDVELSAVSDGEKDAIDTYELREFYSILDNVIGDYDAKNRLKFHAYDYFRKIIEKGGCGCPPVAWYAVATYLALKDVGMNVDFDEVLRSTKKIRPWGISFRVKLTGRNKNVEECIEKIKRCLGLI